MKNEMGEDITNLEILLVHNKTLIFFVVDCLLIPLIL